MRVSLYLSTDKSIGLVKPFKTIGAYIALIPLINFLTPVKFCGLVLTNPRLFSSASIIWEAILDSRFLK